ncbi:hypothetical protein EI94DRAFT_1735518 [Lactarius quietus]|nr:hypothetical protein EI94DRAFT_1739033 [Lactarius quietus]KAF8265546.1 hypothetical protein EI94DRAFT_1735518 [Lactarius quietus]
MVLGTRLGCCWLIPGFDASTSELARSAPLNSTSSIDQWTRTFTSVLIPLVYHLSNFPMRTEGETHNRTLL